MASNDRHTYHLQYHINPKIQHVFVLYPVIGSVFDWPPHRPRFWAPGSQLINLMDLDYNMKYYTIGITAEKLKRFPQLTDQFQLDIVTLQICPLSNCIHHYHVHYPY